MGRWENGNFGKNALSFPLSCHLLKVHICHASCPCICWIYRNRVVKLVVVCLLENVWLLEKSLQESLKSLKSLKVSKSHVEFDILYKLLYINALSFLLHLLSLI